MDSQKDGDGAPKRTDGDFKRGTNQADSDEWARIVDKRHTEALARSRTSAILAIVFFVNALAWLGAAESPDKWVCRALAASSVILAYVYGKDA